MIQDITGVRTRKRVSLKQRKDDKDGTNASASASGSGNNVGGMMGAALGTVTGPLNSMMALSNAKQLSRHNMKNAMMMGEFNYNQEMKMWDEKNYTRQIEELKEAGMSPGVLMGKGGSGITNAGAPAQGNPTQGTPIPGGMDPMTGAMMLTQMAKMDAETKKIEAETPNVAKTGENIDANTRKTKADAEYQEVAVEVAKDTKVDKSIQIQAGAREAVANAEKAEAEADVKGATVEEETGMVLTRWVGLQIENDAKLAGIKLTEEQTRKIPQELAQGWEELYQKDRANDIGSRRAEIETFKAKWDARLKDRGLDLYERQIMINAGLKVLEGVTPKASGNKTQSTTRYDKNGEYMGESQTHTVIGK